MGIKVKERLETISEIKKAIGNNPKILEHFKSEDHFQHMILNSILQRDESGAKTYSQIAQENKLPNIELSRIGGILRNVRNWLGLTDPKRGKLVAKHGPAPFTIPREWDTYLGVKEAMETPKWNKLAPKEQSLLIAHHRISAEKIPSFVEPNSSKHRSSKKILEPIYQKLGMTSPYGSLAKSAKPKKDA
ncbi:hypothetical protein HY989_02105 [Candidatus Micrarchaeota archaeon]|nr:hypothetical protein [Candidatus Micrarchaeota archaeon]